MSPGRDAERALAPPLARAEATDGGVYDWIAEPTAQLIDLLDAERAYYTARVAALAASLAAEMTARVPTTS